ncbi:hypothetical protein [Leptobacterium sp. I13]|uniref:hypothetical protein n=1 Tax=Leptobacterium meishanense TaxID=3128904 RepID=UPI0030EB162F
MKYLFFVLSVISYASIYSQELIKLSENNLQFRTPKTIMAYDTGEENVYGYENDFYSVDIEAIPFHESSEEFIADIRYAAYEVAALMGINNIQEGGFIPSIANGFYIIGEDIDIDGSNYPIIVLVIMDISKKIAYEITIDCYDKNIDTGIAIVQSFQFY